MPRLSLPYARKSVADGRRVSRAPHADGGSINSPSTSPVKAPPPPPAVPPPPPKRTSSQAATCGALGGSTAVGSAAGASSDVDALRQQVEAEQAALRQKRMEREARRLRRQLELAEANDELPAEPPQEASPPPLATRGRQMSNVI